MHIIAWYGGKWLAYEERANTIDLLKETLATILKLAESGNALPVHMEKANSIMQDLKMLETVHRGEHDLLFFAITYFSEDGNPNNADNLIPKGVSYDNSAEFHKDLCGMLNDVVTGKASKDIAYACPRGHAKTSYLSNVFVCHQTVYRHKQYILIVSETNTVATQFMKWTNSQLKFNEKLREHFGEILHQKANHNEKDNDDLFITHSGTKVEVRGANAQTRGLRYGSVRPQLILLDDIEGKSNTGTPDVIQKTKNWFNQELLPARAKDSRVIYMGTLVTFGCLLDYVLKERKDFTRKIYSAITSQPVNGALWDTWLSLYKEDREDSEERADAFYKANKDAMDEGAKVLWSERWTYEALMKEKANVGSKAFATEYMNEVLDEESQIFREEDFMYYTEDELYGKDIRYFGACDVAMGKERGDFSVIVTMAKNMKTGVCYVVDIYAERVNPTVFMKVILQKTLQYQYSGLGVEAQAFQEFFAQQLKDLLMQHGYPATTRLQQIKQRSRKELRIESMLPHIQNGKIRFLKHHQNKLEQFIFFGNGALHDDIPDAVQMAFDTAQKGYNSAYTRRQGGR